MAAKFELFTDAAGRFRFHLKAATGETSRPARVTPAKAEAQNGIASIQDNAASAPTEDVT